MKKIILALITVISISACKKEELSPSYQLEGLWRATNVYSRSIYPNADPMTGVMGYDTVESSESVIDASYSRFSNVTDNSVDITGYWYENGIEKSKTMHWLRSGNLLIFKYTHVLQNGDTITGQISQTFEITGSILKLSESSTMTSYGNTWSDLTVTTLERATTVSNSSGGTGCPTVQCSATAASTGNRCLHMTTNCNGRCWQHQ